MDHFFAVLRLSSDGKMLKLYNIKPVGYLEGDLAKKDKDDQDLTGLEESLSKSLEIGKYKGRRGEKENAILRFLKSPVAFYQ